MSAQDKHAGLEFPFGTTRGVGDGAPITVAESIVGFRHSLPFALDHVNCWLLGEGDEQVLVDTGIASAKTKEAWCQHLAHLPSSDGIPTPDALLVTHFHPDHMGLAGWFAESGVPLIGTQIETEFSRQLWSIEDQSYADFYADWYGKNGLPDAVLSAVKANANSYKKLVHTPPPADVWKIVDQGDQLSLGGHEYEVLIGRGHAPHMMMLYRKSDQVLIAADQVLPSISPNVSVLPRWRDSNPLQSFLDTLHSLRKLPEETLVLPSHGAPFTGLWQRIEALEKHHELRLEEVLEACEKPHSAYDLFAVLFKRELDAQQTSFALGESLAHLHYLEARGELSRTSHDGIERFVKA